MNAPAEDLVIYAAGSLREAVGQIAREFGVSHGMIVRAEFGPAGRMRARIEQGERVDLFISADVGHPRKLLADRRARVMAMFARNALCILAPRQFALTTDAVMAALLDPAIRIGISPPAADPLGDYTMKLFDHIGAARPGTREGLHVVIDTMPGSPAPRSGDNSVDALWDGCVDVVIVYSSGRARYLRLMPDSVLTPLPADLHVSAE